MRFGNIMRHSTKRFVSIKGQTKYFKEFLYSYGSILDDIFYDFIHTKPDKDFTTCFAFIYLSCLFLHIRKYI